MALLQLAHKSRRMNVLENYYIQVFHLWINLQSTATPRMGPKLYEVRYPVPSTHSSHTILRRSPLQFTSSPKMYVIMTTVIPNILYW